MTSICRLCLRNSTDVLPLFETVIGDKLLDEIIVTTLGVELDSSLDFPRQVCQACFKKVDLLYEFYQELIKTQSLLSQKKKDGEVVIGSSQELNCVNSNEILENSAEIDENKHDESTEFVQERIEHEPITIKDEPIKSDEMDCTDTDHSEKGNSNLPKQRRKNPKVVERIPNKCYVCGPILENEDELYKHLETHKKMLPYECAQCTTPAFPIVLSSVDLLNKHFESHGFNYVCRKCPLRFRASNFISYHMQTMHVKGIEKRCETCGKVFKNAIRYRNHVRGHMNVKKQRYKCETCQRLFVTLFSLHRHEITHLRDKGPYPCKWCKRVFEALGSCKKHEPHCKMNQQQ